MCCYLFKFQQCTFAKRCIPILHLCSFFYYIYPSHSLFTDGWQENQEYSLHTFDEHAPLVSIRDIKMKDAVELETIKPVLSKPSTLELTTSEANKANPSTTASHSDSVDNKTDTTIVNTARPKRNISSRTVDMMVEGLGIIKVSKDSIEDEAYYHPNNTNTTNSTTTLLDKRAARQREQAAVLYISHSGRQVAGRDFEHQDMCNECWDGGDLIVCDMCPMAFHLDCIGMYLWSVVHLFFMFIFWCLVGCTLFVYNIVCLVGSM